MCLIVHKDTEIEIAKKDITVYKIVDCYKDYYIAPYYDFQYIKNKLYSINNSLILSKEKGSCFDSKESAAAYFSFMPREDFRWIHEGFHFAFTIERLYDRYDLDINRVAVRCTIPKGSKFVRGIDHLLGVSDTIILH